jgi:hypothetical protein
MLLYLCVSCDVGMQELISDCWHQQPDRRPHAHEVVQRLQAMAADIAALEEACARGVMHDATQSRSRSCVQSCCPVQ